MTIAGTMETADINARLPSEECIDELWRVLRLGGRFCMESGGVEGDALQMELKRYLVSSALNGWPDELD